MRLFGFEFKRVNSENSVNEPSFVPKETDDGAVTVAASGSYGTYIDLEGTVRTEAELVTRYREMSLQPEVDTAIDEIINELVDISSNENPVKIVLDDLDVSDKFKKIISEEFEVVLRLLDFNHRAYEIVRRWYIDGRLYYHVIIDVNNPQDGIKELRYIDPRKIRKIREISKKRMENSSGENTTAFMTSEKEYYVFTDRGFNYGNKIVSPSTSGFKIAKDSILYITSGLTDTQGTMVLSYLHKAIKAVNQLRTLEDAVVIYRLARAPERRLWYIDVGNLPKMKAEQYVRDIMVKHRNRLVYDASSGTIRDDRKFLTMLEDYWLPRREGGRGTEVSTLPAGQNLGEMEDVLYFQKKLYNTLNVPVNRLDKDNMFTLGRAAEITRDEIRFFKFIVRLRNKFSSLFTEALGKQLALKGLMTIEEWEQIYDKIKFDFTKDNHFAELKTYDVLQSRLSVLGSIQPFIGTYYSHEWVLKNILQMNDDDIRKIRDQIQSEVNDPIFNPQQQIDQNNQDDDQEDNNNLNISFDNEDAEDNENEKDNEEEINKLADAYAIYKKLKDKENKTEEEMHKFRSAIITIAHAHRKGMGYIKHPKKS